MGPLLVALSVPDEGTSPIIPFHGPYRKMQHARVDPTVFRKRTTVLLCGCFRVARDSLRTTARPPWQMYDTATNRRVDPKRHAESVGFHSVFALTKPPRGLRCDWGRAVLPLQCRRPVLNKRDRRGTRPVGGQHG